MTSPPAFVTGGSGFIGRHLLATLVRQGRPVRALARSPAAAETVARLGAEPVRGDLADRAILAQGMRGCGTVFHSAALVALWGDRAAFQRDTVQGTANVVAAAGEAGVACLVHVGTEAVLADGYPIVDADETRPLPARPNGPYPWSKGLAERAVLAANGERLRSVSVRPRFVWGAGDTALLPRLAVAMRSGLFVWFGDRHHRMSTCHVANVVHGLLLAEARGRGGEAYFVTDGAPVDFSDFLTRLVATQGVRARGVPAPLWAADLLAAAGEMLWRVLPFLPASGPPLTRTTVNLFFREVTVSDAKARRELGYAPVVSIVEGLRGLS
jgi:nucleoside-diphosphate-sugar epimerase